MSEKFSELYKQLRDINIDQDGYIEWKEFSGKSFGYLQWAIAEELFLKVYDDYDFVIRDFGNGKNYYADETGAYVETTIIAKKNGVEFSKTQQLQILDNSNEPQKLQDYKKTTSKGEITIKAFTMADVENTIQRCKVKNFQQFGLAADLYQGKIKQNKIGKANTYSGFTGKEMDGILQQPQNQGTPIDKAVIEEIIQRNNSQITTDKVINYFDKKNWMGKYGAIKAKDIELYVKNSWIK